MRDESNFQPGNLERHTRIYEGFSRRMSEEGPKLYANKPKKAQLKQYQQQRASAPSAMASSGSSTGSGFAPPPPPPPPPPQPRKESFARRYKFMWPILLAVNFTVGVYLFVRTKKKDMGTEDAEAPNIPATPVSTSATSATVTEKAWTSVPVMEPPKLRSPIPEDQQRELFKWMLVEKRKVKPKDPEEKKRIDEEKAILKQFIRANSNPSI